MKLFAGLPGLLPFQHAEFRHFIVARFFLIMALRMLGTVAAYQLFQITRDSFSIGLAGLAEFIPVFCLALYAGHVNWYVDYSHGVRLIKRNIRVNGKDYDYIKVLQDPVLYKLLCDEPECTVYRYE